jgi:hypothetical protein
MMKMGAEALKGMDLLNRELRLMGYSESDEPWFPTWLDEFSHSGAERLSQLYGSGRYPGVFSEEEANSYKLLKEEEKQKAPPRKEGEQQQRP